ncbi:MAG: glutamate racemase [Elusimicrobiota bacterium]|nr:glutamate racemase [Elusimicrobiota bacterium]
MNIKLPTSTMQCNAPIGVFDSGVGGLTVVKEIFNNLANESVVYFGDTARVPYGSKSKDTVKKFALQILKFLLMQKVKLIVVACNTASSFALQELKNQTTIPIVGVIDPVAEEAVKITTTGRIGVIGTEGTIRSRAYEDSISFYNRKTKVFSQACPLFVPLVEEGWTDKSKYKNIITEIAKVYLAKLKEKKIDTLILGCTHYPLIKSIIGTVMGSNVKLIDSAGATARYVKKTLTELKLLSDSTSFLNAPKYSFYVSDAPEKFISVGKNFLDRDISGWGKNVKKINIEKF